MYACLYISTICPICPYSRYSPFLPLVLGSSWFCLTAVMGDEACVSRAFLATHRFNGWSSAATVAGVAVAVAVTTVVAAAAAAATATVSSSLASLIEALRRVRCSRSCGCCAYCCSMLRKMLFGDVAELLTPRLEAARLAAACSFSAMAMPSMSAMECGVGRLGGRA